MTEPNTPRRFLYGTSSCKNATLVWTNLVSLHVYVHETFVPHVTPPPRRAPPPLRISATCCLPMPLLYPRLLCLLYPCVPRLSVDSWSMCTVLFPLQNTTSREVISGLARFSTMHSSLSRWSSDRSTIRTFGVVGQ